jgi:hypothetical protein
MEYFTKKLEDDLLDQKKLYNNTPVFILSRNLSQFNFNSKISILHQLPIELIMGNIYLIKGSIIIQSYSWCDYNHRPFGFMSETQPLWINKIELLNIKKSDPMYNTLYDAIGDDENYNYYPDTVKKYITSLINDGFKLYYNK